ncbi:PREDICTED: LOW QUALITY PROTEIN: calcium-responsive transcription factor [Elephantulus edwardii]|uniref:LOW QUALITY PROTEIN: calcium-responsive transcription factor n=1 Tax=Elephantulus edwardii TaxID=28737 RepID=UPI0003F09EE2|nr:PREDICTED: LOW QUALITY PROTEIN: calcium-responsive transcription factor [Elephantulus edwardii]
MEQSNCSLRVNHHGKESKTDAQVFEHLTCMDSSNPSFGENGLSAVMPITTHEEDNSLPSQNIAGPQTQPPPAEHFHLVDQNGQPMQYELQSLGGSNTEMMIVASPSENGHVLQVIPSTQTEMAQVIIPQEQLVDVNSPQDVSEEKPDDRNLPTVRVDALVDNASNYILHPQASFTLPKNTVTRILEEPLLAHLQPLSSNTPIWACRLRSCEKIGDSYRGYCISETELESVLTFHKQQTQSVWGTRQSPSPAKPATRLMWKSQYVPYDGIPFVNAGSRAVVMECQYGPRRKGFQLKKISEQESRSCQLYKATCPARIYIKKVQKFPEYRVPTDPKIDRKIIRMEQEKAFNMLKKNLVDAGGVLRWYVQLPTQQAHQYHELEAPCLSSSPSPFPMSSLEEEENTVRDENCALPSRLHPQVACKIRELVSQGVEQVYAVRKQLSVFYFVSALCHLVTLPFSGNSDIDNYVLKSWAIRNSPGESISTKVEANQTRSSLSPEPTQLFSSLSSFQPKIFAQLQGLQLPTRFTSPDESPALISVNNNLSSSPSRLLDSLGSAVMSNNSPLLGQSHSLQTDICLTPNNNTASAMGNSPGPDQTLVAMDQLVEVGDVEDTEHLEGNVPQILLGDVQTIPIRIIDSHPTLIEETPDHTISVSQVKQEPKEPALPVEKKKNLDCKKLSAKYIIEDSYGEEGVRRTEAEWIDGEHCNGIGDEKMNGQSDRKFVERELFRPDEVPERHNLSFFPTVNDLKNHIHEVQKSLKNGDMVYNSEIIPATLQWTTDNGNILRETVTVTFAEGSSMFYFMISPACLSPPPQQFHSIPLYGLVLLSQRPPLSGGLNSSAGSWEQDGKSHPVIFTASDNLREDLLSEVSHWRAVNLSLREGILRPQPTSGSDVYSVAPYGPP